MPSVLISNLTTTWNNAGTTFTGIKLNVTDTASAAASLLMDLQIGGVSKFKVDKIGALTAPSANIAVISAGDAYGSNFSDGSFAWTSANSSPISNAGLGAPRKVTSIHLGMRRCLLKDDGTVNYYLDPLDSTKKATGGAADLSGADGMVMVEIPKFYTKREVVGTLTIWSIRPTPTTGYTLHPAFTKDGVEVNYRYYSAYDACVYDASAASYISGTNLNDASGLIDTGADKLASVSGIYPMVGLKRSEFRALAANRGTGWRQVDFWLVQAVQLLYLVEYQTYHSQSVLGAGNTNGSYIASSSSQNDSPHTVAGASNTAFANYSTNATQASAGAKPGTAYMSYRGIENWFGNGWKWVDGFNINDRQAYVSNTRSNFNDDTSTNYTSLGAAMPSSDGYVTNQQAVDNAFLPASVGGSSATYWTDYYSQSTGWRVAGFGGDAGAAGAAGGFSWYLYGLSSTRDRSVGARLAF